VEQAVRQYFGDVGRDEDLDTWRTANLAVTPDAADLTADYR